nr:NADH dehydrogenase subunit 6 [Cylindrotaenia sp. MN-2022]
MLLVTFLFCLYFIFLLLFSSITHSVFYCGLLVVNALISSLVCYNVLGFGWYSLIFCLVYIGGVYILFVFVSVHNPNNSIAQQRSLASVFTVLFSFSLLVVGGCMYLILSEYEFSSCLCNSAEGSFYVCLCLTLVFSFFILSMVMSIKFNYYR